MTLKRVILFVAALLAMALPEAAPAQVVTSLPVYIDNSNPVYDFGNGPLELKVMQGNAGIFTASATGVGSGTTTSITLTASAAANPPCIGCGISGGTLGPTSIVTAFNGTTGITVNTSQTIAASTALAWGTACPTSSAGQRMVLIQAGQPSGDIPLYTTARICGAAPNAPGAVVLPFAIGGH